MKTAIYVADGITQLVITPETEFEKEVFAKVDDKLLSAKIMTGSFYESRAGFVRQSPGDDKSLIIKVNASPL